MTLEKRKKEFSGLVSKTIKRFGAEEMTRVCGIDAATAQEWANGTAYPNPLMMRETSWILKDLLAQKQGGGR